MLAIYITEVLQPVADAADNVLLYYFCSNRDKNRNNALTIKRGILHQGIDLHPHLVKDIKKSFEGTETTKYTISSFVSLWGVFLSLLQQSTSSQVVCVLDGLDECEKEPLRQLLNAVDNLLVEVWGKGKATTAAHHPLPTSAGCFGEQTRPISADLVRHLRHGNFA